MLSQRGSNATSRREAGHDGKDDNEKAFTKEEFKPIKVSELRHHPKTGQKWEKRN